MSDPIELIDLCSYLMGQGWTQRDCARFVMGMQMAVGHPEWAHALVLRLDREYTTQEVEERMDRMGIIARKVQMSGSS